MLFFFSNWKSHFFKFFSNIFSPLFPINTIKFLYSSKLLQTKSKISVKGLKALATKTIGLRSISYNFETIQGKIYIAGITSRPNQLEQVVEVVKTIKGVKEIVNYVVVKENE